MTKFVKQNDKSILIERVEDEHEESKDYVLSFWFENRRHYVDDFVIADLSLVDEDGCGEMSVYRQNDGTRGAFENPMYIVWTGEDDIDIYREQEV